MKYVVYDNEKKYQIIQTFGFEPKEYVCIAPDNAGPSDGQFITIENGVARIDEALKLKTNSLKSDNRNWDVLREKRDFLLWKSDWSMLSDVPLDDAQKIQWKVYRQALRDLPQNTQSPGQPQWPEIPK